MKKPELKREVAVKFAAGGEYGGLIVIVSTDDAITEFVDFGDIRDGENTDTYFLHVDPRYNFDEVLAYIENYGNDDDDIPF